MVGKSGGNGEGKTVKDILHGIAVLILFFLLPALASCEEYIWLLFVMIGIAGVLAIVGNKAEDHMWREAKWKTKEK